ncbi:MAG: ABC transporter ATP-binding protein [Candidatus Aminicenantaceae bacterium]
MNNSETILQIENLGKDYPLPKGILRIFDGLSFQLQKGELVAVMGVSGVGKTTLLNLLGLLDSPSQGRILLDGEDISLKTEPEKAEIRNRKIAFIFQFYHLLPEFNSVENISFPLLIRGVKRREAQEKALRMLAEVSLSDKELLRPGQLSGGEQQRIAIARALVSEPALLLADEPTGNLDWRTGKRILELIQDLHHKKGLSSVIVTHNEKVAEFCQHAYLMESGRLVRI